MSQYHKKGAKERMKAVKLVGNTIMMSNCIMKGTGDKKGGGGEGLEQPVESPLI